MKRYLRRCIKQLLCIWIRMDTEIKRSNSSLIICILPCSFRIRDVYPGSRVPVPDFIHPGSRVSDTGSKNSQKNRRGKNYLSNLFCSHKYYKILNYSFRTGADKKLSQFTKNFSTFYPKNVHYAKNVSLGSGIREKPIPDSGSQIQGSKWNRIPDSQHCFLGNF
jgi:hypothetical protein